jgi:hypothetical protein
MFQIRPLKTARGVAPHAHSCKSLSMTTSGAVSGACINRTEFNKGRHAKKNNPTPPHFLSDMGTWSTIRDRFVTCPARLGNSSSTKAFRIGKQIVTAASLHGRDPNPGRGGQRGISAHRLPCAAPDLQESLPINQPKYVFASACVIWNMERRRAASHNL